MKCKTGTRIQYLFPIKEPTLGAKTVIKTNLFQRESRYYENFCPNLRMIEYLGTIKSNFHTSTSFKGSDLDHLASRLLHQEVKLPIIRFYCWLRSGLCFFNTVPWLFLIRPLLCLSLWLFLLIQNLSLFNSDSNLFIFLARDSSPLVFFFITTQSSKHPISVNNREWPFTMDLSRCRNVRACTTPPIPNNTY